ncbi:zinc-binding dehydrogenase [Chelativorans sp. AA-79]|uniref:MDR/zinc-dependent alcohol dehydrogenase-like family protein n=1 Tax=Chelativorans sp. AA-79 TaxID=3028735 RepID=UPI0023F90105|nr:zinc-binding dehydrogenase [Chelativorans sp. AA-79]WEX10186.1 zinc-binding dehydrogenase [Chelativorans sp. AA-79]
MTTTLQRANFISSSSTPSTMQAVVVTGPGTIEVQDVPVPEPGDGQIRVRLTGCGVCASNLGPWSGPEWMTFPTAPGALGHEGWGVIDAVGPGVTGLEPGQPVTTLFQNSYAEFDVGEASQAVLLPPELAHMPLPGEPLGCAMNIFRRANIRADQTVAIVGVGFLGAILTRLATQAGAEVIAISRRGYALGMARQMGATRTIPMEDHHAIIEKVGTLTEGRLCERVIEATGKAWPLDLAGELTAEGGRLIVAGYHQDGPRQINMQLWNWRGFDVVNAHERDPAAYIRGMREAVEAVLSGRLDPMPLITDMFPLSGLDDALNATRDRPDGFLKAVVRMP